MRFIIFFLLLVGLSATPVVFAANKTSKNKKATVQLSSRKIASLYKLGIVDRCSKDFEEVIFSQGTLSLWRKIPSSKTNLQIFRTPSYDFAKWVDVVFNSKEILYVRVQKSTLEKTFKKKNSSNCQIEISETTKSGFNNKGFTDKELQKVITSGRGMIYIWSSEVESSMIHLNIFEKAARDQKVQFHAFAKEDNDKELSRVLWSKYGFKEKYSEFSSSFDIHMRADAGTSPLVIVYSKGIVHPMALKDTASEAEIEREIVWRLNELPD